ncbi:hypothetical protein [Kaarinaea lacus]
MSVSVDELCKARETVDTILTKLQIDAYVFEVEPVNQNWEIVIECAVMEGWERVKLSATHDELLASSEDAALSQSLMDKWRNHLAACKLKQ